MDAGELLALVDAAFDSTGADTPAWPDPHPERPRARVPEEEYSRCLDPAKFLILRARVEAWAAALEELNLAQLSVAENREPVWREGAPSEEFETGLWLRPIRTAAVPVFFGFRSMDDVPDSVLVVAAGDPAALLLRLPECGCDACDDGSDALLRELDATLLNVVLGTLVYVLTDSGHVIWSPSGWSGQGLADLTGSMSRAERLVARLRTAGERVEISPEMRGTATFTRVDEESAGSVASRDPITEAIDRLVDEARAGVSPHTAILGPSWLD